MKYIAIEYQDKGVVVKESYGIGVSIDRLGLTISRCELGQALRNDLNLASIATRMMSDPLLFCDYLAAVAGW